jgi:hypothetical protein
MPADFLLRRADPALLALVEQELVNFILSLSEPRAHCYQILVI